MKNFLLIGLALTLLLSLAGCGGGDSGPDYDPNCPFCEPEDFEDHILHSCLIAYRWNGLSNSWTAATPGSFSVSMYSDPFRCA